MRTFATLVAGALFCSTVAAQTPPAQQAPPAAQQGSPERPQLSPADRELDQRLNEAMRQFHMSRQRLAAAYREGKPRSDIEKAKQERDQLFLAQHQIRLDAIRKDPDSQVMMRSLVNAAMWYGERLDLLEAMYAMFSPAMRDSEVGRRVHTSVQNVKLTSVGQLAPDFTAKDVNGKTVSLKDHRGKYVVVEFWGSWCGACRASHPHLIQAYNEYKDKGVEIISIASENDADPAVRRAKLLEAIEKDGVGLWPQILIDRDSGEDLVKKYGIMGYPSKFLLGKDGRIVARFISSHEDVKVALDEIFKG